MISNPQNKYLKKELNIACLNVRGCKKEHQRETIIKDCINNKIQILGLSETHAGNTSLEHYNVQHKNFTLFLCGKEGKEQHGIGFAVEQDLHPVFQQISERICKCEIQLVNRKLVVVVAYAPTLYQSEKCPEIRDEFYKQLDSTIEKVANRHSLVVMGDFNAKIGSGWRNYPEVIGHFGKGHMNSNGQALAECMKKNNLILTNTLFRHKLSHVSTWEAPERKFINAIDENGNKKLLLGPDGRPRKNPFRNQIDYIAVRNENR